jgi:hypothetical protein
MLIEHDESPTINEQQPCEPDDQFDEDLMRYLADRSGPNPHRQPLRPQ